LTLLTHTGGATEFCWTGGRGLHDVFIWIRLASDEH
jgi:hypothetical protein